MRRALHGWLPALSQYFGIHLWEIDLLTYREIESYLDAARQIAAANQRVTGR